MEHPEPHESHVLLKKRMSDKSKSQSETSPELSLSLHRFFSLSLSFTFSLKTRQMEGGALARHEQMAAPNVIYEINNFSQIEFRNRNTLPEF